MLPLTGERFLFLVRMNPRLTKFFAKGMWLAMLIYKIFRDAEWQDLKERGTTRGAPVDLADGYVHFSTGKQVGETCAKYFTGETGLMLLVLEANELGPSLKWEPSRGGALFPHLYRPLRLADIFWQTDLPLGLDGRHRFPDGVL